MFTGLPSIRPYVSKLVILEEFVITYSSSFGSVASTSILPGHFQHFAISMTATLAAELTREGIAPHKCFLLYGPSSLFHKLETMMC